MSHRIEDCWLNQNGECVFCGRSSKKPKLVPRDPNGFELHEDGTVTSSTPQDQTQAVELTLDCSDLTYEQVKRILKWHKAEANQRLLKLLDELVATIEPHTDGELRTVDVKGAYESILDFIQAKRLNLTKKGE